MAKIKKIALAKHESTISSYLAGFIQTAVKVPLPELGKHLATLDKKWPFSRGDLYHWIPLLGELLSLYRYLLDV
jgi:E3 ubiquitin-protein ligase HUWE1